MTIKRVPLKKKVYHIAKYSKKRQVQVNEYNDLIKENDSDGKVHYCYFCSKTILGTINHHHLAGRDGEKIIDKKYLVDAHVQCHFDYHNLSVERLKRLGWWFDYLNRLRLLDESLYNKELNKENKQ